MGLSYTPISFTSSTIMSSSNVNSNFTAMQSATSFTGTWVAENNTSVGILIEDYSLTTPLSQTVIRVRPPSTCPDRGIVFSSLKGGAVSDRLGISTSGKLLTGLLSDTTAVSGGISYMFYFFMSGVGNGTFNFSATTTMTFNTNADLIDPAIMINCGTTSSGGSAASIGFGNIGQSTVDIYCGSSVPWIALIASQ